MTRDLWLRMVSAVQERLDPSDNIHTGGAAWADHIAVHLFLGGFIQGEMSVWLSAPLVSPGVFVGPLKSSASASNYYHEKFSQAIGENTRLQILEAQLEGAWLNSEPAGPGYGAFFARNNKIAERAVDGCIALTWGDGDVPMDGGTKYTWDRCSGERIHIPLRSLL